MFSTNRARLIFAGCIVAILTCTGLVSPSQARSAWEPQAQQPAAQSAAVNQVVGTIKAIAGTTITLAPDKGAEVTVIAQPAARVVRVAPGQTDLKTAPAIQLSDLQVGDRILVRGKPSDDAKTFAAAVIIAMKRSDVDAKQQQERDDWQKRGIGGLVSAVDPATGAITISVAAPGGAKTVAIHTTKDTTLRRYAPDSVQFDDAKTSTLDQVKPGDQLRARGVRSADGSDFAAEEIVSGAFRNIAGTINSVDAAANTVTVTDLVTKKTVAVKITPQSQVLKIPPQMAQGLAMRLKGAGAGAQAGAASGAAGAPGESARPAGGGDQRPGGAPGYARAGGGPADLQQIVSRLPAAPLTDFQKGDAVMIVSTEGTSSGGVTAITMLGGVEPILASPSGQQAAMNLSPWNIGGGGGGEGEGGTP
jgi:hypothetical protein